MNYAHIHLAINHLPVMAPIFGAAILLVGLMIRSAIVQRVAYGLFIFGALLAMPASFSGEQAEKVVENLPGVTEQIIEHHEDTAGVFVVMSWILGLVSIFAFWANLKAKSFVPYLNYALMLYCIAVLFYAKQTATTGGEIRHTEIRAGVQAPAGVESEDE